jgi:NAD(P)-dependent dehydrogenase (short-subunit alcohol dehydrogenase family)
MAAAAPTSHGFVAPEPPQSSGIAVFPDVELSQFQSPHATLRNSDPNAVFVVNGASRGIGLQFVKHLLSTTKGEILACCRSPDTATGLQEFLSSITDGEQKQRIQLIPLDLEDQTSIENAGTLIRQKVGRVDLLLNVAGILGDSQTTPGPERSVTKIERQWMEKTFQVNVIGPVMFSKELVPLLGHRRSKKQKEQRDNNDGEDVIGDRPNAVIANLSARVGSISDNGLGGWYSYRMSKSALNQATRTLSNELKRQNVWCIALHPGTTDTDLSKPFQKNVQDGRLFPVEFTVGQLKQVIDSLDDVHTGGLYDWAGKAIPF